MLDDLVIIDKDKIVEEANNMKLYNYRFVSITCEKEGDNYEMTYHFDLNYKMKSLRFIFKPEDKLKSISHVFPAAFLMENEYQDLYGFTFEDLIIDYKGNLYLTTTSPKAPLMDKNKE